MSDIITDIRTIPVEAWQKEYDGKWYVHIPFECEENDDVIMEFVDPDDYVQKHKKDFDALNNGFTTKNQCTITSDTKPTCDMHIKISKAEILPGRIIYTKDPTTGQFIPEWQPDEKPGLGGLFGALGGLGGMSSDIIDAMTKKIDDKDTKEEDKSKIII